MRKETTNSWSEKKKTSRAEKIGKQEEEGREQASESKVRSSSLVIAGE